MSSFSPDSRIRPPTSRFPVLTASTSALDGQAVRAQPIRIDVHLILPDESADRRHLRDSGRPT